MKRTLTIYHTLFLLVFSLAITSLPAPAQRVIATIPVGSDPGPIAVNLLTNKIYVATADIATNTIKIIDGATNSTSTVMVGSIAIDVAVDSARNKVYVAGQTISGSGSVTIIDGATLSTTIVSAGRGTRYVAVNTVTNKIYAVNSFDDTVTVIDGLTLSISTITLAQYSEPTAIAVNSLTNKIYVVESNANSLAVIDGATLSTTTVPTGSNPTALAINSTTNKVYVANFGNGYGNTVTVINGATLSTATVNVSTGPGDVAVNETTNQIYTSDSLQAGVLTFIDGATLSTFMIPAGPGPNKLAVDAVRNKIYVTNLGGTERTVTVIDGNTYSKTTVGVGFLPVAIASNSVTNRVYVSNQFDKTVSVTGWPGEAVYDSTLKVPKCDLVFRSCDSGPSLLLGRDNMAGGAEPNQPNTIHNSCADGTAGTFHVDESIDRLTVATTDGGILLQGEIVRVNATVWVADPAQDALDLYYATNATTPAWSYIGTIAPRASGFQTLSLLFRLRPGPLQAVRANFRKGGTRSTCSAGSYDDHDDLAFSVR